MQPHGRWIGATILLAVMGCAFDPSAPGPPVVRAVYENPALVPVADRDFLFHQVVDVVDDYFTIDREEPLRVIGDVITQGQIETFPELGATLFEPWRGDSVGGYERLESTLQSIRRKAFVRVVPGGGGYLVDVAVFKELEDVPRPEFSAAGIATFRNDSSLERTDDPIGGRAITRGWIPLGRDTALEQRIIAEVLARTVSPRQPIPAAGL
jgi:hypothetical protein